MSQIDPAFYLSLPPKEREKNLETLSMDDQAILVLLTPWEQRHEIILHSPNSRELVRGLPVEELFWTIKASSPEDALAMSELALPEQLQFILDLDWWAKDRLRPEKVLAWLVLLFENDRPVLVSWLTWILAQDPALVPAVLQPFLRVVKRPDDMDIQEALDTLPPFTLDDVYFISFRKQELVPLLAEFLKELLGISPGSYRDVMETLLWDTPTETLEHSYRMRCARLGSWGIPDYFDAIEIYAPLPEKRLKRRAFVQPAYEDIPLPVFVPTLYGPREGPLAEAVSALSGTSAMGRIVLEWTGAANKILVADQVDWDDVSALRSALEKVSSLLNLSLDHEKCLYGRKPAEVLAHATIEDLIHLANGIIRGLSKRARALIRERLVPKDLIHLPEPWALLVEGLSRERPVLWNPVTENHETPNSMGRIEEAEKTLLVVEDASRIMPCIEPHWTTWEKAFLWSHTNLQDPRELLWPSAILTALALWQLTGTLGLAPIPRRMLRELRRLWVPTETFPHEDLETVETAMKSLADGIGLLASRSGIPADRITRIVYAPIEETADALAGIPPGTAIDPRFLPTLLISMKDED